MENNKKTVVYARTSSEKQSIDLQLAAARPFLKGVQEENVVIFTEIAASKLSQQVGLKEIMRLVENDQVDTIIVYQRDRLTRSFYKYLEIIDLIYAHKVKVIFTLSDEMPFQHDQEVGVLKEFYNAFLLEKERNHMSNRIKSLKAKSLKNS